MIYKIISLMIFSMGLLTREYLACSMGLLTLLVLIKTPEIQFFKQLKGGKKKWHIK